MNKKKSFKTKEGIYPKEISPLNSLIIAIVFSILLIAFSFIVCYSKFSNFNQLFANCFFIISIASVTYGIYKSRFEIKQDEIAILYFMGNPIKKYYFGSGIQTQLLPYTIFHSPNKLNFQEYNFHSISSYNKIMMNFTVELQWYNIDIFQNLNIQYEDQKRSTENQIKILIDNYIQINKLDDYTLINDYTNLAKFILENIREFIGNFGDEIDNVILKNITSTNPKRINIFEADSEINYYIIKIKKLMNESGMSNEDAIRVIAIKEGLMSSNETIYKINGIEKIFEKLR